MQASKLDCSECFSSSGLSHSLEVKSHRRRHQFDAEQLLRWWRGQGAVDLGPKVSRCCGVSRLWNRRAALHSFMRLGTGGDVEDQSNDQAPESGILLRCQRHQGTRDWFSSWWFWRGFLSPSQKTADVCRCGRWCLNTFIIYNTL